LTPAGAAVGLGIALAGALAVLARARRDGEPPDPETAVRPASLLAASAGVIVLAGWSRPHLVEATRLWVWDDYTYHMVYPALWLQERAIAAVTPLHAFTMQAWYPLSASVVSAWFHWDSMRYVALLPILGWAALGVLIGARSPSTRPGPWPRLTAAHRALTVGAAALALGAVVASTHGAKASATGAAIHAEPLFGAAATVLDGQPAGSRVAVFGDQWIYPAFGERGHLHPVRLDRDGRPASQPIGDAMEPGDPAVDPATFRANLAAAGIDVVVLVRQPHPGRPDALPAQHAALERAPEARLVHRDRAVAIWRLTR
jgi:hypothetical protein